MASNSGSVILINGKLLAMVKIGETWVITGEDMRNNPGSRYLFRAPRKKCSIDQRSWATKSHSRSLARETGKVVAHSDCFSPFSWHHLMILDSRAWYVAILVHFNFSTFQSRMINAHRSHVTLTQHHQYGTVDQHVVLPHLMVSVTKYDNEIIEHVLLEFGVHTFVEIYNYIC